ncbi:MAG: chemotaxis protein CheW [Planctomycetes bacterium]|nr:chemotaxis protein CheW [Planctomycetota bacterium]
MQLVVFGLSGARCALAAAAVERVVPVVEVTPLPGAPDVIEGVIEVEGVVVPVFDLRARFGLPARAPDRWDHLLLSRAGARRVALRVDHVDALIDVDPDRVTAGEEVTRGAGRLAGVARLPDGLAVVHDLAAFLDQAEETALAAALAARRGASS